MAERFRGKVAFVSGGTGALGRKVVEAFYTEGAKLVITYRSDKGVNSLPKEIKEDQSRVLTIRANLADEDEVETAFQKTIETYGTVDYLLNIAGGYMGKTPINDLGVKDWNQMMEINLNSAFHCSRSALRIMLRKRSGRIISISAMAGLRPTAGRGAYAISKAGVALLTQIIADEIKGTGITANCIAPTILATEANIRSSPGEDHSKWVDPREVADLILYLCTDAARSISGTVIQMSGGI